MILGLDGQPTNIVFCKICGASLVDNETIRITDDEITNKMHDNPAKCILCMRVLISQVIGELNAIKSFIAYRN